MTEHFRPELFDDSGLSDQENILLKDFFVDDHPMNILIKLGLNSPSSFGKENQNEKSLQTTTKNAK
jgi:site-specific recombinase